MEIVKELKKKAQKLSVLYVEDDPQIREEMAAFLNNFFRRVEVAADGEEGIKRFQSETFPLVVTDIKMPKLNGLAMAKEIKKLKKETKIIVTSAYDEKNLLIDAIENSIDHYLVKPIDFSDFIVYLYKTVSLINLERRVEKFNRHMQAVLNYQDNMIMTLRDGKITSMNRKFLDFFQLASLKEVYDKKISLIDFVVNEVGYFYPKEKENWADELQEFHDYSTLVKLIDRKVNEPKIFSLKIGNLEEFGETIISLTNISEFMESNGKGKKGHGEYLFFDQERIPHFFTYLKNEINRTKRHGLALSIIQLVISGEDLTSSQVDAIDGIIGRGLKLTDCLAKPMERKYIIVKTDTEIAQAHTLARDIHEALGKQFLSVPGFQVYVGVVGLGSRDTMQEILGRAEKLLQESKESGGEKIKHDLYQAVTPATIREEQETIFNKLATYARKRTPVKIISFYNGMKIVDEGTLLSVDSGKETALLKMNRKQHVTIHDNDKLFIVIDEFSADVEADVEEILYHDGSVRLKGLGFTHHSPLKREYVRVTTEPGLSVELQEGKHNIRGEMIDISLKSLACEVPVVEGLVLGKVIDIVFSLPLEKDERVEISAEIYKIVRFNNNYRVVLLLLADRHYKQVIMSYITKREKKIATEMKKPR